MFKYGYEKLMEKKLSNYLNLHSSIGSLDKFIIKKKNINFSCKFDIGIIEILDDEMIFRRN
jgi:hypothetical protein